MNKNAKTKAQKADEDANLDEALTETFPASDPLSMTQPRTGADVPQRRPRRHPKREVPSRKKTTVTRLSGANPYFFLSLHRHLEEISSQATERDALSFSLPWYAWRNAKSSLVMNFTIKFFRTRPNDEAHATLDRISIVAENLDTATVKAKSLFDTLDMPQKPDGLRILDQVKRELFVWVPDAHDA